MGKPGKWSGVPLVREANFLNHFLGQSPAADVLDIGRAIATSMRIHMGFEEHGASDCLCLRIFHDRPKSNVILMRGRFCPVDYAFGVKAGVGRTLLGQSMSLHTAIRDRQSIQLSQSYW